MTEALVAMLELTSRPRRAVEAKFAADSSGFGTTNMQTCFSTKQAVHSCWKSEPVRPAPHRAAPGNVRRRLFKHESTVAVYSCLKRRTGPPSTTHRPTAEVAWEGGPPGTRLRVGAREGGWTA
jgi:hypothetical protein